MGDLATAANAGLTLEHVEVCTSDLDATPTDLTGRYGMSRYASGGLPDSRPVAVGRGNIRVVYEAVEAQRLRDGG